MRSLRTSFVLWAIFAIAFMDEFIYSAREAAWPQIRDELGLSYSEIGLLLAVPQIFGNLVEPPIGLYGNSQRRRRRLVLLGGAVIVLVLLLYAVSGSFWSFLLAATLFSPASGAFVNLSEASLMDAEPTKREKNMARWALAGYIGVAAGPLILSAMALLGLSWRGFFVFCAALMMALLLNTWRSPLVIPAEEEEPKESALKAFKRALQDREVLRYSLLLELADLMMDVLYGFLALYLVDVGGLSVAEAGLGVAVWTLSALLGDALLVVFIERIDSTKYLRLSALLCIIVFLGFQLAPGLWVMFVLLALLGASRAGWYSILNARLYDTMPGHSGVVMALHNVFNFAAALVPIGLGLLAEKHGLWVTMWLLLLGPISLLIWVHPRATHTKS